MHRENPDRILKIAHVINTFPPHHGGMGYICFHNARVLAQQGHNVTVFTLDHGRRDYQDNEIFKIVRLKSPLLYGDAGILPQLYKLLRDFDVIHLHYPFFGGAEYVYLASIFSNKKYFLTYHMDVYSDIFLKKSIIKLYESFLLKRIVCNASLICSPGINYLKSTKVGQFVPWEKVTDVIYGGVDTQRFLPRPKSALLLEKHRLAGKTVALFVGNLLPFKGLHLIFEALRRMEGESDLVLMVVGGGYHEAQYRRLVDDYALHDRVIFAGPQSPAEALPDYYNLADFFILPSTHSESFGLVILEAMASGKPAIVSALPGPSGLVRHGETGFIVNIGDVEDLKEKMLQLYRCQATRLRMGTAARASVEKSYCWEVIGRQLEENYRKMISAQ